MNLETTPEETNPPAGRVAGVCIVLVLAVLAVFGRTAGFGFVNYDDEAYVFENPVVQSGLSLKGLAWVFTHADCFLYHPLTMLSLMGDYQLHGLHAGGYHLTNVLLHTASVLLLFLVLRQMTGALWRSAFVAAVYAIHPLRVESVAWVAERKDVLSAFFFMLTLGAYVRYVRSPNSPGRYLLVVAAFVLALLSKPSVVTLPFVLLLLDYWPLRRFEQPRRLSGLIREKIPLLTLAVGFSVITKMIVVAVEKAPPPVANLFMASRVGNALVSYAVYLRQMVWPQGLAVPYPFPYNGLPAWEVALAGALLAGLSAVAWGERRTRPYLLVGWLWYLGMLVPMLGVIELSYHAHADRYTYLPGIGLALAVTWAIGDSSAGWKHRRAALGILMAAVIGALMVCAWIQTGYWKNSETLWNHTLACTEDNSMACYGLGSAFFQEGRVDDAITQYQKGLEINSNDAQAQNGLGSALLRKGRVEEAAGHFQKSLQINPNYAQAHFNLGAILFEKDRVDDAITQFQKGLKINSNDAQAQSGLGEALLRKGKVEEAAGHLQKALQIDPANAQAHYNLGAILFKKGRVDEAMAHYQHALQIDPDYTQAHYNLANILLQKGRVDEAAAHYQRALQSHPDYTEAHVNLGNILLQKGRIDEAIFHYEHALQIDPDCAPALVNLGGIFLQKGRAAEAISRFQHALQLQPNNPEVQNSLAWLLATSPEASLRNGEKAVQLAQRANELAGGRNPVVLHTLAAAFAEAGRFGDAVRSEQKAIELARAAGRQDVAGQFSAELERYAAGLPFKQ